MEGGIGEKPSMQYRQAYMAAVRAMLRLRDVTQAECQACIAETNYDFATYYMGMSEDCDSFIGKYASWAYAESKKSDL